MQLLKQLTSSSIREARRSTKRYTENAKRRGDKQSKFDRAKFLAWDGEGIQKGDKQVYGLLANSNNDYIIDLDGLSTEACLNFLTSSKYSNNTIHVCFGASYDVNMMLRDIPIPLLMELHKGDGKVMWGKFDLEYRPRKSFTVRKYKTEIRNGKEYKCYDAAKRQYIIEKIVTLWDVFGFFQKKFTKVIKDWSKGTEYEQKHFAVLEAIEQGKQRRGSFSVEELKEYVVPYCLAECDCLRDIMHILHGYLLEADLKLARWDGAGAVAAAGLKKQGIKRHIRTGPNLDQEPWPERVAIAAEYAYFGGWIEAFMFGHILKTVYHYDLRSAYPSALVGMPSLSQGAWITIDFGNWLPLDKVQDIINNLPSYWIGHVAWSKGPKYGPCPFSWRNKLGTVTRPVQGRGWHWSPEIVAAYKLFPKMQFSIDTIHFFVPNVDCEKPFQFVKEVYELRRKLKDLGKGMELVLKLYLNSLYGKLAQSLGYNSKRRLKPPYHCLILAGLITSETRAKLLHAAMQKPLSIISIATDGIYSLEPLDLDIGPGLGQWEYTQHDSMTIVQPGFYWYETKGKVQHYYRGFNEGCIQRGDVVDAYNVGKGSIDVPVTRFVTLGAAIGLNDFSSWLSWKTDFRTLDLIMLKSSKRVWTGDRLAGNDTVMVTKNKIYDPKVYKAHPEMLESKKYAFDWDGDREVSIWQGQTEKERMEEMFHMELSIN